MGGEEARQPVKRILPLLLVACSGTTTTPAGDPTWALVEEGLDPAVLAIAPVGDDVLAVGGPLTGDGPSALFFGRDDALAPRTAPSGWTGAIWWAWGAPSDVWLVGAHAQIAHGALDSFQEIESKTSTATTFYGVWGSASDDVWIVGGDPRAATNRGTILRWNGTLERVTLPDGAPDEVWFKVWGAEGTVMVVGTGGAAMRYDGATWTELQTGVDVQLTTVHGTAADRMFAVGGLNQGVVLAWDGASWTSIGEPFAPALSGVSAGDDGRVWVAGDSGYLAVYDEGAWTSIDTGLFTQLHAVLAGADATYGVGGVLTLSPGPRNGFVGRYAVR